MSKLKTTLAGLCLSVTLVTPIYAAASWYSSETGIEKKTEVSLRVDINTADLPTLISVKHLGKARAKAIVDYRAEQGKFKTVYDLTKVQGISKSILKKIFPYLTAS